MYIKIRVQWTYNDIHNNHSRCTLKKHKYNTTNINTIRINLQSLLASSNVNKYFFINNSSVYIDSVTKCFPHNPDKDVS